MSGSWQMVGYWRAFTLLAATIYFAVHCGSTDAKTSKADPSEPIKAQPARANVTSGETYTVIHYFTGYPNDGASPIGGLASDSSGNLYGATSGGGAYNCPGSSDGCGAVFKILPDGTETILHSFGLSGDGSGPESGVILDSSGNIYGTTAGPCGTGCGTVFKVAPDGTETVLHQFEGGTDGSLPFAGVTIDDAGNLYGTTVAGGSDKCQHRNGGGCGIVYKITPGGTETVLYAFPRPAVGRSPLNVVLDKKGNLFGTVESGGKFGYGILFKLPIAGKIRVLHEFGGGSNDGAAPFDLIIDDGGNVFGDTLGGGAYGGGTIYKLSADRTETVLHNFSYQNDGEGPDGLLMTKSGVFYGTAENDGCGYGDMFKLSRNNHLKLLHCFGMTNGWGPEGKLVRDATGTIYGTASVGGTGCDNFGCGVVYEVGKQGMVRAKFRQSPVPFKMPVR